MISTLSVGIDHSQRALGIDRGVADDIEKLFLANMMATALGRENTAAIEQFQRSQVNFLVAAHGAADPFAILCERGRV